MATVEYTAPPAPPVPEPTFTLTLSVDEACYVVGMLGAGSQRTYGPNPPGPTIHSVLEGALVAAGIGSNDPRILTAYTSASAR